METADCPLDELFDEICKIGYPITVNSSVEIYDMLCEILESYIRIIQKYPTIIENETLLAVKDICCQIQDIHRSFCKGEFLHAYNQIDELLSRKQVTHRLNIQSFGDMHPDFTNRSRLMYRARIADPHIRFKQTDMAPISVNKREKVPTYRFSAIGMPCLYLAGSSYTCWLEVGRPPENEVNISQFTADDTTKILNLSLSPLSFMSQSLDHAVGTHYVANEPELLKMFLMNWPLSLACSIKNVDPNERMRMFKEEYVIPQLIMQSLNRNGIDGVAFLSTYPIFNFKGFKFERKASPSMFVNYAFPAKKETLKKFRASDPLNLYDIRNIKRELRGKSRETAILYFSNSNCSYPYNETIFYHMDSLLLSETKMPFEILDCIDDI